jgi:hypothetical protein
MNGGEVKKVAELSVITVFVILLFNLICFCIFAD